MQIDDSFPVQGNIMSMLSTLSIGPRASITAQNSARGTGGISVSIQVKTEPLLDISGFRVTDATLNNYPATNLSDVGSIGDLSVGAARVVTIRFPDSAGAAGTIGSILLAAENDLGQRVTLGNIRVNLP
jgi:hypothetical protein